MIYALLDGWVVAKRNLIKIKRVPDLLVFTTLSPIMFVLLFAYVFGGSIDVPGVGYKEFLIAGIFAQTVVFGSTFTGYSLAEADNLRKAVGKKIREMMVAERVTFVMIPPLALVFLVLYPKHYKEIFLIAFVPGLISVLLIFFLKEKRQPVSTL